MNRRRFLLTTAAAIAAHPTILRAARPIITATRPAVPDDLHWHDVRDWPVQGRGFSDTENFFDRLPARAKPVVRPEVWNLSRHTAGMQLHLQADAPEIFIRYQTLNENLAMPHMPATGVSGLDLYGKSDDGWHFAATYKPAAQTATVRLAWSLAPGRRRYLINLPLYNGVKSLELAVPTSAFIAPVSGPTENPKPILFYGTSVTQGGCASRPGMAFTNILARRLARDVLNFGFSGQGRMEVEVVRFLAEIDSAIFIFDCVANTSAELLTERTAPCVKVVREAHPKTPILLLDQRRWAHAALIPDLQNEFDEKRPALKKQFDTLRAGDENLHYFTGDFIGADGEATVDGSHPTDLGMVRYADSLEPELKRLL